MPYFNDTDAGDYLKWNELWDSYYNVFQEISGAQHINSPLITHGFVTGSLDAKLTQQTLAILNTGKTVPFRVKGFYHNYCYSPADKECEDQLNRDHLYFDMTPEILWHMDTVLEAIKETVDKAVCTPWRVLNVRSWKTIGSNETSEAFGPLNWHDDGMPSGIFKVMVYLVELSDKTGTVELKLSEHKTKRLQGPAGTYLIFRNSAVFHRGIPPAAKENSRVVIEITAIPSMKHDLHAVYGGLNSRHPIRFWETSLR